MKYTVGLFLLTLNPVTSFPWVPDVAGVDSSLLSAKPIKQRSRDPCPFNPNHKGAAPITEKYPYLNAKNGLPGTGKGGVRVPAPGDKAHYFEEPGPLDIRGPCPGLNTAANHHFISHDGITTMTELIDMQQNVYNLDYDIAVGLAALGVGFDGDLVTEKLSIGCDATSRTAVPGGALLGRESGLNGHNKFELDTSLTRNDFFLANGDDYTVNATMFGMMAKTCNNYFDFDGMALYRYQRYKQSRRDNPHFWYGPGSTLINAAATFLYELFPGDEGKPDLATEMSFFGISQNKDGTFRFNNREKIPDNWSNRKKPYTTNELLTQTNKITKKYKVQEGGNAGKGHFVPLEAGPTIIDGHFQNISGPNLMCFLYQTAIFSLPVGISKTYQLPVHIANILTKKLEPGYQNMGCPLPLA